ncbi:TonB-dependent receptor [Erythrobacter sp. SCSIO 43205]|uniref:TonB-dependent receptor domain-containing protein n=1 Tax=Erythrobacter sp. SCSIO 43205 TaxID=2779361 RepID=UPI001CA7D3AB|nr:TonB-dependent receptor [Erythrobacter sp. SCSIO 43205]UAB79297.1 TonB-dependent receptor [Erythrobacter sp. SCSIO 43205]
MRTRTIFFATLLATTSHTAVLAEESGAETSSSSAAAAPSDEHGEKASAPRRAFTTGVAKGRDMLDTAISASVLSDEELRNLSVSSVAGILQNIPGFRSETADIDGFSAITIRGLPLAADGSKWVQLQEDGLPVLEFGDIRFGASDQFLRADLGLAQVQSIRGGSASTFASNSPGGVVNFISRTGEVEGGMVQLSSGLDHDLKRIDFSYGAPISENWRFHVGGFYREGEGPREVGYNAFRGGQVKANVTREFDGGYIRLYGKYLDDRQPNYSLLPVALSGTNEDVEINQVAGFDILDRALSSQLVAAYPEIDRNNNPSRIDASEGIRGEMRSVGLEAKFDVAGWTVTNKFRYSDVAGAYNDSLPFLFGPASTISTLIAGPGAQVSFATGPQAGNLVTDNRFIATTFRSNGELEGLDNMTNDLRASRVWNVGDGVLTTTAGLYNSNQSVDMFWRFTTTVNDLGTDGPLTPLNFTTATGFPVTDAGVLAYGFAAGIPAFTFHNSYDLEYDIVAPYGSVNYRIGKLALGASVRWDNGSVSGNVTSPQFGGGRPTSAPIDLNGDGQLSLPESAVVIYPLSQPSFVDYEYDYVSYSVSANYRVSEPFSVFGRYSRGGRANGPSAVGPTTLNLATGAPDEEIGVFTEVRQAEVGFKYRTDALSLYVTGFWAATEESNFQISGNASGQAEVVQIKRDYEAKGIEFEGSYEKGQFSIAVGASYTDAEISDDFLNPAVIGNTPRHIPDFAFFARPQVNFDRFNIGAVINATAESFAQDTNILVQPGYVLVSPFATFEPADNLTLGLNVFNVFDETAIVSLQAAVIPANGLTNVQVMNGRTVTASVGFSF